LVGILWEYFGENVGNCGKLWEKISCFRESGAGTDRAELGSTYRGGD